MPASTAVILISANVEWRAIRGLFPQAMFQPGPYGEFFEAALEEPPFKPVTTPLPWRAIFMHGGWGKIAAAASTQYALDRWRPALLVNLGTCGGFEGRIARGEIILAEKTIVYDIIEQMGDFDEHIAHYTTEIDLGWLAPPYPQAVRRTLLVSGDRDLLVEDIPLLAERYGAVAGDWESGAIAWTAVRNVTPTLVLRGVTDLVGPAGGEAYGNLRLFEQATLEIMQRLVQALPAWLAASSGATRSIA